MWEILSTALIVFIGFKRVSSNHQPFHGLREAIVAAVQSGRCYKTIFKQVGVQSSTPIKIIYKRESIQDSRHYS